MSVTNATQTGANATPTAEEWRSLALEAAAIDPQMDGINAAWCAFCHVWCALGRLPVHKHDCLVLRVEALRESERVS